MHDVIFGECFEGLEHVHKVEEGLGLSKMPFVFDEFFECSAIAILIDEVVVIDSLEDLNELDDVLISLDFRQSLDFVDGAFLQFRTHLELLDLNDFDGHQFVGPFVGCLVHFPVLALPNNLLQIVVLDFLDHLFQLVLLLLTSILVPPIIKTSTSRMLGEIIRMCRTAKLCSCCQNADKAVLHRGSLLEFRGLHVH